MIMSAINLTLEQFRSVMLAAGYDEVTERSWDANTKLDEHTHPFDANAIVVSGNFWLSVNGGETKQYLQAIPFMWSPIRRTRKNMAQRVQPTG